ncbi:MMPL family transporter [Cryobacterium algoritolerans]|uniref:MMPL family transporter n=1 Tax=Cryobacterium algoritolerans TaxID=1259184 RepID=A0A4V3IFF4_9MICO|nr:MMPL family transporter [Cryobacterium algoritolerans]TFC20802.1 MMPL family transporter [Cryobacterium algoritolerans]
MLHTLGVFIARHRFIVLIAWAILLATFVATALGGVAGETLFQRLSSAGPTVKGEASEAKQLLRGSRNQDTESLSLLIYGVVLSPARAREAGPATILAKAAADLRKLDGVSEVVNPLELPPQSNGQPSPAAAALFAKDGRGLLLNVAMTTSNGRLGDAVLAPVRARLDAAAVELRKTTPDATVEVGGTPLLVDSLVAVAEADLQKGELISLPIALLVMLLIFGGFLAAGIPLIGAIASIVGALGTLYGFSFLMDIDTTVLNVITVIGLGLSIDYGLLIVSRFREEFRALVLRTPATPPSAHDAQNATAHHGRDEHDRRGRHDRHELMLQAVGITIDTAGRTVLFSGLTFANATVGLLVFEPTIIRAIAVGAVSVVLIAILTALVLVPALLGYFGERLLQPGLLTLIPGLGSLLTRFGDVAPQEGVFSKLTRSVQRAPTLIALVGITALLLLGSPVLGMNVTNSGSDAIPRSSSQYGFVTALNAHFPLATGAKVQLVADTDETSAAAWADQVAARPYVTDVTPPAEVNGHWVSRVSVDTHEGPAVVREVRADRPGFANWVGGSDAASVDYTDSLLRGAPWAALIVAVATFLLLFLMTGSVVIPVTALVISTISLGASVGVLVWGFQEGNLSGVLNFEPATISGVDPLVLTLVLTFGFGLAMDYEMFLLSRIKEHYDRGESTRLAIETGLQSSGRIITSAGLIIVLVFAGFATGDLLQLKQIGTALAVAVLLDATLVRAVLVPSVMTSLERILWWAPRWMHPLHARFGLRD